MILCLVFLYRKSFRVLFDSRLLFIAGFPGCGMSFHRLAKVSSGGSLDGESSEVSSR